MFLKSKPAFYAFAECGPWSHHVFIFGARGTSEAQVWLQEQGIRCEVILPNLAGNGNPRRYAIMLNDPEYAIQLKLMFGGK